jgi:iron uptake system EfeUOB component EfeO/EfeM
VSRRQIVPLAVIAATLVTAVIVAVTTSSAVAASARQRPCSSYPAPGQVASRSAAIPASIKRNYAIFAGKHTRSDGLNLKTLETPLQASGIITSGIRYLGRTRAGYKLYAVPARHYTMYKIAPLRCFAGAQRGIEKSLLPRLRRDYKQPAICVVETGVNTIYDTELENCGPPKTIGNAMLAASGLPLVGIAPNSVRTVDAMYLADPDHLIRVRHNFYEISGGASASTPCGVQWLQESGNNEQSFAGCDYETTELPEYKQYQSFVKARFESLQDDVNALAAAISSGNLANAESAWLTAHIAWLALGQDDKQYGAFGNLGNDIDGTSAGLVGGATSAKFTGFHKIELDLWTDHDLTTAAGDTAALQKLIAKLIAVPLSTELPNTLQGVANWLLRPHEILEDADRDTLTGDDEYGSGTAGASITADVEAAREDISLLTPTLKPLDPRLVASISRKLSAVSAAAEATKLNGDWVAMADMTAAARERLDAAAGSALETLSQVPDLLTSTGPAAPPT